LPIAQIYILNLVIYIGHLNKYHYAFIALKASAV